MRNIPNDASTRDTAPTYDPLIRGIYPVGVQTISLADKMRARIFPCEVWYPAGNQHIGEDLERKTQDSFRVSLTKTEITQMAVRDAAPKSGTCYPLILFSHSSGGDRRSASYLCTHLSSHGYVVAALDHSELVTADLRPRDGETPEQKAARCQALIANRVPDLRFLLHQLLNHSRLHDIDIDTAKVGLVGHSFGGWTVLATPDVESRVGAVVALAPAGASERKPDILPVTLSFNWQRDVPTLYLVAENDSCLPLTGMYELFSRTPGTKRMVILRRADHLHFMDSVEELHETIRQLPYPGTDEMRPIAELCSGEQAHAVVRGLTLCHLDAVLKPNRDAQMFLAGDVETELARRGLEITTRDKAQQQSAL